jgi:hypothetical protein
MADIRFTTTPQFGQLCSTSCRLWTQKGINAKKAQPKQHKPRQDNHATEPGEYVTAVTTFARQLGHIHAIN